MEIMKQYVAGKNQRRVEKLSDSEELYKGIIEKLNSLCEKQNMIRQEYRHIESKYSEGLSQLNESFEEKIKVNKEQEARLVAYINIAKDHTSRLEDNGESEAYDAGLLSRLTVQINHGLRDDPFAGQLFMHASYQLRNTRAVVQEIYSWLENQKLDLKRLRKRQRAEVERKEMQFSEEMTSFVYSEAFMNFIEILKGDAVKFDKCESEDEVALLYDEISIGTKRVMLPVPDGFDSLMIKASMGIYDSVSKTIGVPVVINTRNGEGVLVEYKNENESEVLNGIQNFILNVLRYSNEYEQIIYVDPVRYNNSSLGILQPLSVGGNSVIDTVPLSMEEVRKKLNSLIAKINIDERKLANMESTVMPRRLLILHNFPHAYDSTMVSQIQQMFVNASHYNVTIIATYNISSKNTLSSDTIELIKTVVKYMKCSESSFEIEDSYGVASFKWYKLPESLPQTVKIKYIDNKPVLDTGSNYDDRIGVESQFSYKKGVRRLENIPYGVDTDGNILSLDFENSNFATFICGASRSGKSTLLHTLITGLIRNNHPDDIELWLIDFKMTEFSRYIDFLPPHVRYIILDESPELVYDIIDRLTEILIKRQNVFKGKWQKLNEVPKDKYMPAILVIIDEFSVMSQIVADSLISSKENYSVKLQTLLAKGAALGLHFIFASQGFTSGTRGLNDFSKKQIQQRIAMKTEYNEIKETLDLKSASDDDRAMMEQLPIHHALVRIPVDDRGNHIKQTKVLYIEEYKKQENLINHINTMVQKAPKYDVNDTSVYIDKKSMIIDGANYSTFLEKRDSMLEYIACRKDSFDYDEAVLFLGEPRRMLPLYPINLNNGFCENILIVSPIAEKMATASVVMSIIQSLEFMHKDVDIWTTKKNEVYRQVVVESKQKVTNVFNELGGVCSQIRNMKSSIENKVEGDKYIFIFGTETLMMDMSYQGANSRTEARRHNINNDSMLTFEKRDPGEMDLNALLSSVTGNKKQEIESSNERIPKAINKVDVKSQENEEYDARADLKFIMMQGPRFGYHFVILFNTVGELNQSKIDVSLCKHKILFRMAKADAASIIGSSSANVVAELENHSFRYSNGIDALSFRPYLHPGLSWDGWSMNENAASNDEEEEYLM